MEIIHSGWLIKSPPESKMKQRGPFKSQWRRRFFVLYAPPAAAANRFVSGFQAVLDYYENQDRAKRKGSIDLRHCEEVRDRLDSVYYRHLFMLHTHARIYYLAAESEADMDQWVDRLIRVLGLNPDSPEVPPAIVSPAVVSPPPVVSPPIASIKTLTSNGSHNLPSAPLSSLSFSPGTDRTKVKDYSSMGRQLSYPTPTAAKQIIRNQDTTLKHATAMKSLNELDNGGENDGDGTFEDVYNYPTNVYPSRAADSLYQSPQHTRLECVPSAASSCEFSSQDDLYDHPPHSEDVYDHPPSKAHPRSVVKVHSYINAPSAEKVSVDEPAECLVSTDETYDRFPSDLPSFGVSKLEDSDDDDDADEYEQCTPQSCKVSMSSRTRSFRSSTARNPYDQAANAEHDGRSLQKTHSVSLNNRVPT